MDTSDDALLVTGVVDTRHVPLDQLAGEETAPASLRRILPAVEDAGRAAVCRFGSSI